MRDGGYGVTNRIRILPPFLISALGEMENVRRCIWAAHIALFTDIPGLPTSNGRFLLLPRYTHTRRPSPHLHCARRYRMPRSDPDATARTSLPVACHPYPRG